MTKFICFELVGSAFQPAGFVYLDASEIAAMYPSPARPEEVTIVKAVGESWSVRGDVTGVRDKIEEFLEKSAVPVGIR